MGPDARGGTADTTGAMGMASRKHSPVTSVVGHGHIGHTYIYIYICNKWTGCVHVSKAAQSWDSACG